MRNSFIKVLSVVTINEVGLVDGVVISGTNQDCPDKPLIEFFSKKV